VLYKSVHGWTQRFGTCYKDERQQASERVRAVDFPEVKKEIALCF